MKERENNNGQLNIMKMKARRNNNGQLSLFNSVLLID